EQFSNPEGRLQALPGAFCSGLPVVQAFLRRRPLFFCWEKARADRRQNEASRLSPRLLSSSAISAARLIRRSLAMVSSTAQNSGSRATDVACPARLTLRFF